MNQAHSPAMQKKIFSELVTYLPARLLPALTPLLTIPIYTRLFSPDIWGKYILAFGVLDFLLSAAATGLAASAVRFFAIFKRQDELPVYFQAVFASGGLTISVAMMVSAGTLLIFGSTLSAELRSLLWITIPTFGIAAISEILMNILRAQERSKYFTLLEVSNRIGVPLFSLIFILVLDTGVSGLLWGQCLALTITTIPLFWVATQGVAWRSGRLSQTHIRQIWRFSFPITFGFVAIWMLRLADRYIIEIFQNSYEVGLYSIAYNIAYRSIFLVIALFLLIPDPILMRVWEEDGRLAAERALTSLTRVFFLLVVPAVVGITCLSQPMMRLLVAEEYYDGHRAVWLVACSMMAQGLATFASMGIMISMRSGVIARNQLSIALFNLVLSVPLVAGWGFMGAAASNLLSSALLAGLHIRSASHYLTWRWPVKSIVRVLVSSLFMGGAISLVALIIERIYGDSDVLAQGITLLIGVVIGGLVYGLALWVTGEISIRAIRTMLSTADHDAPGALPIPRGVTPE